jgi:heterodisulfide reductase subunit B
MAEYTDVVAAINAVHKSKGGTYDGDTAVEIVELAAGYYRQNTEEVLKATPAELRQTFDRIYSP